MLKMKSVKTGAVRAVLSLTLGVSISSLANASLLTSPDAPAHPSVLTVSAVAHDDLPYNMMQSEIALEALLSDGSAVVTASFSGVEQSVPVILSH